MSRPPRVLNRHTDDPLDVIVATNVMRPTVWGNPFKIGVDGDRAAVVAKYRARLLTQPDLIARARVELRGQDLFCCCAPLPCHGGVLLEIANDMTFIPPPPPEPDYSLFDPADGVTLRFAPAAPFVIPPPPPVTVDPCLLPRGSKLRAGRGFAEVLPDLDFETFSEAGFLWEPLPTPKNPNAGKWLAFPGAPQDKKGLPVVGAAVYAEHSSTEVLCAYYDLKDGRGRRPWLPGQPMPVDLIAHVMAGGLIEAHNSAFEYWIWNKVCTRLYGWPPLPIEQCRCSAAKSRAYALPGKLESVGAVLRLKQQKDADGTRLIKKFSIPRNPTAKDPRTRIRLHEDPVDGPKMIAYNEQDIVTEAHVSAAVPDLVGEELEFWLLDQRINRRGVQMDVAGVHNCCAIVDQALEQYNRELYTLTGGHVARASELAKMQVWLSQRGVHMESLDEEHLDEAIARDDKARKGADITPYKPLPADARRALEIRALVGSAAVKKVYSMRLQMTAAGRLHDLFTYYGARTGRCIAEGELVLTRDQYGRIEETPIEAVTRAHELWDGAEWVAHGGVITSGEKEVMEHDGLTATPDHRVYLSTDEYATLAEVKERGLPIFRGENDCPTLSTD